MIGKLLSGAVKVVTLPVDVAEAAVDVLVFGGDGTKNSRQEFPGSQIRDAACEALKSIDE